MDRRTRVGPDEPDHLVAPRRTRRGRAAGELRQFSSVGAPIHDWQVSPAAAVRYFERLRAPVKETVPFDGGHFVHIFHSDAFLAELTARVKPLVR